MFKLFLSSSIDVYIQNIDFFLRMSEYKEDRVCIKGIHRLIKVEAAPLKKSVQQNFVILLSFCEFGLGIWAMALLFRSAGRVASVCQKLAAPSANAAVNSLGHKKVHLGWEFKQYNRLSIDITIPDPFTVINRTVMILEKSRVEAKGKFLIPSQMMVLLQVLMLCFSTRSRRRMCLYSTPRTRWLTSDWIQETKDGGRRLTLTCRWEWELYKVTWGSIKGLDDLHGLTTYMSFWSTKCRATMRLGSTMTTSCKRTFETRRMTKYGRLCGGSLQTSLTSGPFESAALWTCQQTSRSCPRRNGPRGWRTVPRAGE